jgi:hypothetical protein
VSLHDDWHRLARRLLATPGVVAETYPGGADAHREALLEQYRLYLDLTDRLAARRATANAFFLTLNTAVLGVAGAVWGQRSDVPAWLAALVLVPLLVLCAVWFLLIGHHRVVSAAKWAVVAAFEEHLPAGPFERTEWHGLLGGAGRRSWWHRLTLLEQVVPAVFATTYVVGAVLGATL